MKKQKYIAVNIILFALLYLLVTFNKEVIRPQYGTLPIIGILTGSFSNFLAAYIISLFAITPIFARRLNLIKSRIIFYTVTACVFTLLLLEELKPFVGASKTFDIYDIIASAVGGVAAIITFELLFKRVQPDKTKK